jgi:hypothetical protein
MNLMRCTVIDQRGGVSFLIHGDALPALVNACGFYPPTLEDLLDLAAPFYGSLREYVASGLAVFDEHNTPASYASIQDALRGRRRRQDDAPVFRVVDEVTREESLRPLGAGAVIFNLRDRRVVQLANTYRELRREGRARIFDGDGWTSEVFRYYLPRDWSLVP